MGLGQHVPARQLAMLRRSATAFSLDPNDLKPNYADAFFNRSVAKKRQVDVKRAQADRNRTI